MTSESRINLDELNSEEFVKRARSLDPAAFDQLCKCIVPRLVRYLVHEREINRADAEELASDTLLKVHKGLPKFNYNGGAKLSTWIFKIAVNAAIDLLRRQKSLSVPATATVQLDTEHGVAEFERHLAADWRSPAVDHTESGDIEHMLNAFRSLSESDQEILRLKMCFKYEEIAADQGCTAGALRTRHARALERLKAAFKEMSND